MKRIKAVEREYAATQFALERLLAVVQHDPGALEGDIRVRDIHDSAARLEGTYLIRLFAEFESSLRTYWLAARRRRPPARTRDLLDGVGAMHTIPAEQIQGAHRVREDRNALVHERNADDFELIPISQAKSHLCYFLSFLPLEW